MKHCIESGCYRDARSRGMCMKHYHRVWRQERLLVRPCGCSPRNTCETHKPPVCVCNDPEPSGFRGQCGRCFRLYGTRVPALRDRLALARIAWRQFLVDEGVFELVTGQEVRL